MGGSFGGNPFEGTRLGTRLEGARGWVQILQGTRLRGWFEETTKRQKHILWGPRKEEGTDSERPLLGSFGGTPGSEAQARQERQKKERGPTTPPEFQIFAQPLGEERDVKMGGQTFASLFPKVFLIFHRL